MEHSARLILSVLLLAVAITACAAVAGWWLAPARRTARSLARALGARPDASAISPERACGLALSAAQGRVALVRFSGDRGLVYPLSDVRGVELLLDGEVKARAFRGEGRRPLDRIDPSDSARVTLRLLIDDPADPAFEVELWRPDDRPRPNSGPEPAMQEARAAYARFEALVQRPATAAPR